MKVAPVTEVKAQFSAYLKAAEEGPVVVTRHGKAVAVLLSVEDDDELERLILGYTPKFQGILEAARNQIRETGGVPHDEFWQGVQAEDPQG
jgi:prevent-host-death family protein